MQDNYKRYRWTSIWLGSGLVIGLVFVWYFCARYALNLGLMMLWSLAYLAIGALAGFIFSVPKIITNINSTPPATPVPPIPNAIGNANVNAVNAATTVTAAASAKARYQENTNLTEISDWLTKILIGASLVELKEIPKFVYHVARVMGRGLDTKLYPPEAMTTSCAAVILYFITWGFISGYIVMKLVLTEQFASLDTNDDDGDLNKPQAVQI